MKEIILIIKGHKNFRFQVLDKKYKNFGQSGGEKLFCSYMVLRTSDLWYYRENGRNLVKVEEEKIGTLRALASRAKNCNISLVQIFENRKRVLMKLFFLMICKMVLLSG